MAPTCYTARALEPRRIDLVFLNRQARLRLQSVSLDWLQGLHPHAAHSLSFFLGKAPMARVWQPAPEVPLSSPALDAAEAWNSAQQHIPALLAALSGDDVDASFFLLESHRVLPQRASGIHGQPHPQAR